MKFLSSFFIRCIPNTGILNLRMQANGVRAGSGGGLDSVEKVVDVSCYPCSVANMHYPEVNTIIKQFY
jgi:hypothetical protein